MSEVYVMFQNNAREMRTIYTHCHESVLDMKKEIAEYANVDVSKVYVSFMGSYLADTQNVDELGLQNITPAILDVVLAE